VAYCASLVAGRRLRIANRGKIYRNCFKNKDV
jgi:hypothetical protein